MTTPRIFYLGSVSGKDTSLVEELRRADQTEVMANDMVIGATLPLLCHALILSRARFISGALFSDIPIFFISLVFSKSCWQAAFTEVECIELLML